jgi:acyl-CoA synthetase (NDP forming)
MELAVADPVIDVVIVDRHVGNIYDDSPTEKQLQQEINDFIIEFAQKNTLNKTLVMSTNLFGNTPEVAASAVRVRKEFATAGVPAYSSLVNAARTLSRLIKYHEFQAASQDSA